ncbi:Hachiman antiphage defense system protein HamA [Gilliamella sp. CG22]|uniref:Hachiman antiphage defense system protein HamA n=1 Tax=Gilliamella sp. CG22 TaxID=3351504 RepID=UPI00398757A8
MRIELQKLVKQTLSQKYQLPNESLGLKKTDISNHNDHVFICYSNEKLIDLIYNSIIDYSFNQFEIDRYSYENLLDKAIQKKIKYSPDQDLDTKIKYGFYGEVLLYSILYYFFQAKPIISRGYFYSPLAKAETSGYDSYHLAQHKDDIYLWFGEVKFRESLASCVKSALKGLNKALSDDYLSTNVLEFDDYSEKFSIKGSKIEAILNSWRDNPSIKIIDEIKKYNMTLVYPILLIYSDKKSNFEQKIIKAIDCIDKNSMDKNFSLSIDYKLFFILMPLDQIKQIKQKVIECIESRKPLI